MNATGHAVGGARRSPARARARGALLVAGALVSALVVALLPAGVARAAGPALALGRQAVIQRGGGPQFVALVRNISSRPLTGITVTGTAGGGAFSAVPALDVLNVGESAEVISAVRGADVTVTGLAAGTSDHVALRPLAVSVTSDRTSGDGVRTISGTVRNTASVTVADPGVVITLTRPDGAPDGVGSASVNAASLGPGATTTFSYVGDAPADDAIATVGTTTTRGSRYPPLTRGSTLCVAVTGYVDYLAVQARHGGIPRAPRTAAVRYNRLASHLTVISRRDPDARVRAKERALQRAEARLGHLLAGATLTRADVRAANALLDTVGRLIGPVNARAGRLYADCG